MKKTIDLLWGVRWGFMKLWVFFFALSMFGISKHTILELVLISGGWSLAIILTSIALIKIKERFVK
jgi:hypothetical protein